MPPFYLDRNVEWDEGGVFARAAGRIAWSYVCYPVFAVRSNSAMAMADGEVRGSDKGWCVGVWNRECWCGPKLRQRLCISHTVAGCASITPAPIDALSCCTAGLPCPISAILKGVCEAGLHARLCSTQHPHALAEIRTLHLQPHSGGARPCRRKHTDFMVAASLSCSASSVGDSKPPTHAQHSLRVGTEMRGNARSLRTSKACIGGHLQAEPLLSWRNKRVRENGVYLSSSFQLATRSGGIQGLLVRAATSAERRAALRKCYMMTHFLRSRALEEVPKLLPASLESLEPEWEEEPLAPKPCLPEAPEEVPGRVPGLELMV